MKKTIITAAINGSVVSKKDNENVPISVDEIVEDAYRCYLSGASIIHVHTRSKDGTPNIDLEMFSEIKRRINEKCDVILNFSTSGEYREINGLNVIGSFDNQQFERLKVISLKPDIATIDLATLNFGERIFLNPTYFLNNLLKEVIKYDVVPEFEIFNPGDIKIANYLKNQLKLESKKEMYQIVLGTFSGSQASVEDLVYIKSLLPQGCIWSAFGIGKNHLKIMYATLALGGHIRVGLEDNIYYSYGVKTNNVQLVKRAARIIKEYGNKVATVQETRQILNI